MHWEWISAAVEWREKAKGEKKNSLAGDAWACRRKSTSFCELMDEVEIEEPLQTEKKKKPQDLVKQHMVFHKRLFLCTVFHPSIYCEIKHSDTDSNRIQYNVTGL